MTSPTPPADAAVRPKRRRGGAGDLVRSLLVVVAVVALIIVLSPGSTDDSLRVADFDAAVQTAKLSAPYDVVVPGALPEGWRTVTARTDRHGDAVVWRVGLRAPDGAFVTLEQSVDGQGPLLRGVRAEAKAAGDVTVAGAEWARYSKGASKSLVRPLEDSDVLLRGEVPWDALEVVAAGVHPR